MHSSPCEGRQHTAEDDSFAMLMAVIHNGEQELVPLAELAEWNAEMKDELSAQGRTDFHEWMEDCAPGPSIGYATVQTARKMKVVVALAFGAIANKIKLLHFLFGDAYLREKHRSCCTQK